MHQRKDRDDGEIGDVMPDHEDRLAELLAESERDAHYFVKVGDEPYREVTRSEWMNYENRAGFHPKFPGHPATAGFSGNRIEGSTFNARYCRAEQYDWKPELRAAIEEAMPSWRR